MKDTKSIQSFTFHSKILAFSQKDILKRLPPGTLEKIKESDDHPYFSMYSICHEGDHQPKILNSSDSGSPITWTRAAVQSIKNIITKGIKLFRGHNKDNSTNNRESLGKVVHSFQEEREGKLHHLVIAYHNQDQKEKVQDCDICSQEGEWNFFKVNGRLIADSIERLTGIALGNSKDEAPAFSGARRLATVQANESKEKGDLNIMDNLGSGEITINKVRKYIKKHSIFPRLLYTIDDLKDDREFVKLFNENESYKAKIEELEKKLPEIEQENQSLKKQNNINTAKSRLNTLFENNPLPDDMKKFVTSAFDLQKDNITDLTDEGLTGFIESQKQYFQKMAPLINPEYKADSQKQNNETVNNDLNKAENNEFLDEDI